MSQTKSAGQADQSAHLHCARNTASDLHTRINKQINEYIWRNVTVGVYMWKSPMGRSRTCGNGRSLSPRPHIRNRITDSCHSIVPFGSEINVLFVDQTRVPTEFRTRANLKLDIVFSYRDIKCIIHLRLDDESSSAQSH